MSLLAIAGVATIVLALGRLRGALLLGAIAVAHLTLMDLGPTPFQRRYSEGLVLGLGGLAVGLAWAGQRLTTRWPLLQLAAMAIIVAGTAVVIRDLGQSGEHLAPDVVDLSTIVDRSDVILSGGGIGFRLPGRSDGRVYVARPVLSIRYAAKVDRRRAYAARPADPVSLAWLRDAGITMVVVDAADPDFSPVAPDRASTCLTPAFERPRLTAYRVSVACIEARLDARP